MSRPLKGAIPRACIAAAIAFAAFAVDGNARMARAAGCDTAVAPMRVKLEGDGGKWVDLTSAQWQFARGVSAVNPKTPPGIPFGDHAALVQADGDDGGVIFFIDRERICLGMAVPGALVRMLLDDVPNVAHEGDPA